MYNEENVNKSDVSNMIVQLTWSDNTKWVIF